MTGVEAALATEDTSQSGRWFVPVRWSGMFFEFGKLDAAFLS